MYNFKIYDSLNEDCIKSWMEFEKTSFHNFFQTIDYIKEVIKKNDSQIKIVILYKNNLIISILPLEIKKYFFFKVLQWIGTGKSDLCNPIISNYFGSDIDEKKFIKTWDNILNKLGGFDLIFFNNQPAKIEEISNPFVDFLKTNIFSKVYQIELSNSFNEYKENIKKKDKKHFYELHRTLIKESNLKEKFKVIFLPKDLNNDEIKFKDIIQNKLIQLENKNIKHNLNKEITNIYENLIKKKADRFFLINLEVEKETVAICFGIIYKNIFYYYMPMLISNNFNNYKPGKILLLKIIHWCIEKKIRKFDFGLGTEKYKKYFSNLSISLHKYIKFKTFLGFFLFVFLKLFFYIKN